MAKINVSKSGIGVRGLRILVGMPAHRPSAHASCVGGKLKDQKHPAAPLGAGGKSNQGWRNLFVAASKACGQQVPKVVKTRITPLA